MSYLSITMRALAPRVGTRSVPRPVFLARLSELPRNQIRQLSYTPEREQRLRQTADNVFVATMACYVGVPFTGLFFAAVFENVDIFLRALGIGIGSGVCMGMFGALLVWSSRIKLIESADDP